MLLALLPTERSDALRLEAFTEANIGPFAMAWSNRELIMQVEQETIRVLGADVVKNDGPWHYALVFPIRVQGENDETFDQKLDDPASKWKELFPTEENSPSDLKPGMTWEDFTARVRQNVKQYIREMGCEVTEFKSVDEDEIFVLFGMSDKEKALDLAEKEEARVRLKPSAYDAVDCKCPTDEKAGREWRIRELERSLRGVNIDNRCPAFVRYTATVHDVVEDVEDIEMIRIVRHGLQREVRLQVLEAEVTRLFFPIHQWDDLQELYARGWSNPYKPFYFPKANMPDNVSEYFGAHVAAFFHLYNAFTRWLVVPALVSIIFPFVRPHISHEKAHWFDSSFGGMMCLWSTFFLASLKHQMNAKLLKWGMGDTVSRVKNVRKNFKDELRGSCSENLRNLLHWTLVILFLSETVFFSRYIALWRRDLFDNPDGMTFGMQNTDAGKYFKYLVTANIKIVDAVWTPLCIYLTKHENHRTEMDLKSAMILKLFAVKSVLFYYPFIRSIFIQPHVEGCPGPGNHISGCLDALRADLQLFFITQVISVGAGLMVQLAMMYWTVRKELQRKKSDDGKLSYVEVQAMLADYDEEAEVSDYLQVVLNFGFLSMFGCVAPSMCVLCFLSNLPMKRLLAFRFSFSQKRVVPIITHGLGSWELILNFIAYIGVTLTCYIVIFAYNSLDLEDFRTQLLLFIAIERAVAVLKLMLTLVFGEKSLAQERIEEQNEEVLELIVASEIKKHHQRTHP
ncbi:unnamed protein product [Durusdinium trenchii]|uniref:Anoctamin transmembrane domain-containing protein n=1 Tax=Durusdinium trenchii TaxID=1381693 RepID=A0ABP0LYS2_9DINO